MYLLKINNSGTPQNMWLLWDREIKLSVYILPNGFMDDGSLINFWQTF